MGWNWAVTVAADLASAASADNLLVYIGGLVVMGSGVPEVVVGLNALSAPSTAGRSSGWRPSRVVIVVMVRGFRRDLRY